MTKLNLYRKRIIPPECIPLASDRILLCSREKIVTSWQAIHPRKDLHRGYSCYLPELGLKISKFLREDGSLLHWYCDIVDYEYFPDGSRLVVTDLLADVIVCPDGAVKVVDLDELADALDRGLITEDTLKKSLRRLDFLLKTIYAGGFCQFQSFVEEASGAVPEGISKTHAPQS